MFYVLIIWGDLEIQKCGPFNTAAERDFQARMLRREHGDEHGLHTLDIGPDGEPEVGDYSGAFFEDIDQ